ncbi:hypothetical protein E3P92_01873 [Wallemia ichthyophaga]|uniref:Splicing factor YJU2 n=2 Tax=Wallemia ichthyophaga TaxID=245174 RepID=A0A4T0HRF8_WALIC|nr:Pre-mRNA-splicing factor cwf16 [Wallemia ichthyophaga EXF-994]TIA73039.1 hypothetical protein E3P91_01696 [Wallemia ichthyophaga]EOR01021.1 Pre-mRNA-splicing factor cwf16 [Wallemia ichthyophaga EXF-994]TIB02834.1 hypothetical protein E3P96_02040 [Wallemia ichthyophaga]TIB14775.1 hypothetical protein E3P92_01873 [Wallemia ichthyophaga]TIB16012.1 hypothetical protein E3P90_00679 [Wallemia ichthyophaga]
MADRKVLNKYYPPDYDPSIIPRMKRGKERQQQVRLMTPYSMRCLKCGDFIYRGKKFNARKEEAVGEDYFGVKVFRFYIKCPLCSSEITFKTDPKNTDYAAEHGATRNYDNSIQREPKKDLDELAKVDDDHPEEVEEDPMKQLEQRTLDSKREMEIMDALSDIRTRNAKNERLDAQDILDKVGKRSTHELNEEDVQKIQLEQQDEDEVAKVFGKLKRGNDDDDHSAQVNVKRKLDEPTLESLLSEKAKASIGVSKSSSGAVQPSNTAHSALPRKKESKLGVKLGVKVKK